MTPLFKRLCLLIIVTLGTLLVSLSCDKDYGSISNNSLREINKQEVVIDAYFFRDDSTLQTTTTKLLALIKRNHHIYMSTGIKVPVMVGISSGGGYTSFFDYLMLLEKPLRQAYIVCTVSKAASMAFTFMINFCDKRIILKDAVIMQHRVYKKTLFGKMFDDNSNRLSVKYSDMEAKVLGIPKDKWFKISRGKSDKYFTRDELVKYGIATEGK